MPSDLQEAFDELLDAIIESEVYQEYLELARKVRRHRTIQDTIKLIKRLQKELVRLENSGGDVTEVEKKYQESLSFLQTYPLYVTFVEKQKEVNEILQNVRCSIEDTLQEIIEINPIK